jgi:6-phospho-beta-glucosidase
MFKSVKIALLGGGGFRTPMAYEALLRAGFPVDELVLHDRSEARLERMRLVLDGLAQERGSRLPLRTTTRLEDAVDGAGAVLCAIRVGGLESRLVDEEVPLALGVVGQETTGPGGLAFALRTVPVVRSIAELVAERAPDAWFINFTNPAGLVTEAAQGVLGDRAIGVCDAPPDLCRRVAAALGRPASALWFDYAGLNHLGWLRRVLDRGQDVLPDLLADEARVGSFEEGRLFGARWLRGLGMVPNEYLYYYYEQADAVASLREHGARARTLLEGQRRFYEAADGTPATALAAWRAARAAREQSYMREAWEDRPEDLQAVEAERAAKGDDADAGYAGVATRLLEGLTGGGPRVLILNLRNRGALPDLDADAVVEVPAVVTEAGAVPVAGERLPQHAAGLVQQVKAVERLTIEAALTGSRATALRAIGLHPLVPSIDRAERILDGYVERQPLLAEALR